MESYTQLPPVPTDTTGDKLQDWTNERTIDGSPVTTKAQSSVLVDTTGEPLPLVERVASGTLGALDDAVTLDATGMATLAFAFSDTAVIDGGIALEASLDGGATWRRVYPWTQAAGINYADYVGADTNVYLLNVAGYSHARLRVSSYTSGSTSVVMRGSPVGAVDSAEYTDVIVANSTLTVIPAASTMPVGDNEGSLTVDTPQLPATLGQTVSAGSLAVVIATDQIVRVGDADGSLTVDDGGESLTVDDGGDSLTVDGTVIVTNVVAVSPNSDAATDYMPVRLTDGVDFYVAGGGSAGGGTEYTEGDTDAAITGAAILWEDTGNTLRTVSAGTPLPVGDGGGALSVDDNGASLTVDGTINVGNFPATQPVSGSVDVANIVTVQTTGVGGPLSIDDNGGSLTVDDGGGSVTVDGTVSVSNFPASYPVTDNGGSLTVDGTVGVSGTVAVDSELTTADLDTGAGTDTRAVVGLVYGASGGGTLVGTANPLPVGDNGGSLTVDGPLTDAQLRATPVPISGTVTASGPLTDTQLRATPLPVSGTVSVNALPAGTANIGDVDVLTLPAIPAGTNNIGDVDVLTLPALPAGTNNIGDVDVLTLPALPAGTNNIGDVDVLTLPALPSGSNLIGRTQDTGDVTHDAANSTNVLQTGGHASPTDVPPTLVDATGDRVRGWYDRAGAQVVRRRKLRESYTAVCRLAETTARMDATFTHSANTNKQLVTFHHAASSTREIRIHKVVLYANLLGTAAGFWNLELRYITGTPATGNPAITPMPHRQGASATEAVCLVLPTTAGTDGSPNAPLGSYIVDHGIEATTQPTAHPLPQGLTAGYPFVLYDSSAEDDEVLPLVLRAGTLEGVAINSRDTAAMVLRFWALIKYTEETP